MNYTMRDLQLSEEMIFFANKKFSEAELNFEDVELAAKSAICLSVFI